MDKQKPVKKYFAGMVTAAIWRNEGKNGAFYSVTLTRRYKDGEDWRDTSSLRRFDLLKAAQVIIRAYVWIDYYERHGSDEPEEIDQ